VASESESRFLNVHVPQLHGVVHTARKQEVASVVVSDFPHGLTVLSVCLGTARIHEVPNLDSAVT